MLKIFLLGTFEIEYERRNIQIPGRPAQSLFAFLVLNAGIFHRRERLAALLWADSPDHTARENLRHTLWQIRKAFGDFPAAEYWQTDDLSIKFVGSADVFLDAAILKTAPAQKCAQELIAALSVYRGELLPGFYEDWVSLEREYLNHVFDHNMARLLTMLQNEKRWLDVLEWGERWIAFGQRPEPAYRALMLAHKAEGEMSKVAEIYTRCQRDLGEIGMTPSGQTRELFNTLRKMP